MLIGYFSRELLVGIVVQPREVFERSLLRSYLSREVFKETTKLN